MQTILVTGANGFVGKHLIRELKSQGNSVIGLGNKEPAHPTIKNLLADYLTCDLNDRQAVAQLSLDNIDSVINLAGLAQVDDSFKRPGLYHQVNVGVLENLGQALLSKSPKARLIAVSTGGVYDSSQLMPLTETSQVITDGTPYALSKLAMERHAEQLKHDGLDCIVVRPFNHIGPGQKSGYLLPNLVEQLKIMSQSPGPLLVGNLASKRDYSDVRDVVKAYALLVTTKQLNYRVYNICSGKSVSGYHILDLVLEHLRLPTPVIKVDSVKLRAIDPPDLFGSYRQLKDDTGWQPTISLGKTVADFVDWYTSQQ